MRLKHSVDEVGGTNNKDSLTSVQIFIILAVGLMNIFENKENVSDCTVLLPHIKSFETTIQKMALLKPHTYIHINENKK